MAVTAIHPAERLAEELGISGEAWHASWTCLRPASPESAFRKIRGRLPSRLPDSRPTERCSVVVTVIDSSAATLYAARTKDRGDAPLTDTRAGPEVWSDGKFFPDAR